MPTTRTRGLSTADLDTLRSQVDAGRRPKVVFTAAAGQVAGQIGQIVRFDDPTADEWVVVRFGRDELPFAPTDLQLPPPKQSRPKATATPAAPEAPKPAPTQETPVTAPRATSTNTTATTAAAASTATRPVTAPAPPAEAAKPAAPAKPAAEAPKPKPARKAPPKRSPELTVTVGYAEGQWSVSASRGAKALVKPTSVRAADALKMVQLLESPAVAEAVEEIVSAARADAEEQADRLRQQLAEVEAALADLGDA